MAYLLVNSTEPPCACQLVAAQRPMAAPAGQATTWKRTGLRSGSFLDAAVEKVLTSGPLGRVVMSNIPIIPSALLHTHYAWLTSAAAATPPLPQLFGILFRSK